MRSVLTANGGAEPGTAMFLLDIDNFKGVNDLYGARVGDAVLKTVAARLMTGTRSHALLAAGSETPRIPAYGDLIARLGADEFGIILGATAGPTDAEAFARRLLQVITAPILAGDQRIRLTANIGYLITGPAHRTEDDVLRDLDVALQEAKMRGPNSAKAWEPALTSAMDRRLGMLDQLHRRVVGIRPRVAHDGSIIGAVAALHEVVTVNGCARCRSGTCSTAAR